MCRNAILSVDTERWTDNRNAMLQNRNGVIAAYPHGKKKRRQAPRLAKWYGRGGYKRVFCTLPDGRQVTIEELVLYLPLDALFRYGAKEFSIHDIRMDALLSFHVILSWKQVRDALYRLNHGKLLFRHIARGVYTWSV